MSDKKKSPPAKRPARNAPEGGTQTLERVRTQKPQMWKVVMHNDDYTTQEYVIQVLKQFFKKDATDAMQLMLRIHTTGRAICGTYSKDVAESKVAKVTEHARENGHPLMLSAEPA